MADPEDEEHFYDSLDNSADEDSDKSSNKTLTGVTELAYDGDADDISTIVPLYSGDTYKKYMEIPRKVPCKPRNRLCNASDVSRGKQRSYLSLFHSKIGYPSGDYHHKRTVTDTCRAIQGDISFRSVNSSVDSQDNDVFQDAQEEKCDSESFYLNHIAVQERNQQTPGLSRSMTMTSLTPTEMSALRSVSEQVLDRFDVNRKKKPLNSRKQTLLKPPVLSNLGPDIEIMKQKQQDWRKRVNYGQKVSEKNRIRIMESKILKELRIEMENASTAENLIENTVLLHKIQ